MDTRTTIQDRPIKLSFEKAVDLFDIFGHVKKL